MIKAMATLIILLLLAALGVLRVDAASSGKVGEWYAGRVCATNISCCSACDARASPYPLLRLLLNMYSAHVAWATPPLPTPVRIMGSL